MLELLSAEQFVKKHCTTQAEGLLISKANFLVLIWTKNLMQYFFLISALDSKKSKNWRNIIVSREIKGFDIFVDQAKCFK